MKKLLIILLMSILALANCVPTSVLVKDSEAGHNNFKVKRSSSNDNAIPTKTAASASHPSNSIKNNQNSGIDMEIPLTAAMDVGFKQPIHVPSVADLKHSTEKLSNGIRSKSTPQKRGIPNQMLYKWRNGGNGVDNNNFYDQPISSAMNNGDGVWGDILDPPIMYSADSDFDDYSPRGLYRNKPYDNLQNILSRDDAGGYPDQIALPIQYYLGDRRKRSNKYAGYDMPLNHESPSTKLTPADMLALVALVEAGERNDYEYNKPSAYYSPTDDRNEMINSWQNVPLADNENIEQESYYSGMPYNLENIPRYEILRDQKYSPNHFGSSKRFMVSKKKRSLGHFYNEPIAKPSISFVAPSNPNAANNAKKYY